MQPKCKYFASIIMEMGERLRQVIESKGITWEELSVNSGVDQSTISRILNNSTTKPHKSTTQALAKYLQIDEKWLRNGEDNRQSNTSTPAPQTHLNYNSMDKRDILDEAFIELREHRKLFDRVLTLIEQREAERRSVGVVPASIRDSQNPPLTKRKQIIANYLRFNPIITKKPT